MKKHHVQFLLAACLSFLLSAAGTFSLHAAENELPLPDVVVLKSGVTPPPGTTGQEINGDILEESPTELKLETSKFRGISTILTLPKSSIESFKRGDHTERDFQLLKPLLELPEVSSVADYYQKNLLPRLEAYLAKYPAGPRQQEVSAFRDSAAADLKGVLDGDVRLGNFWLRRKQMSPEYRNDLSLWQQLEKGMVQNPQAEYKTLIDKISEAKKRPFYPYLVEKALTTSRKRVQFATESIPASAQAAGDKTLQEEIKILNGLQSIDIKPLKNAVSVLGRLQTASLQPALDTPDVKSLIYECRQLWPDLDGIDYVLLQGFQQQIISAENTSPDRTAEQSTRSLKNASELLSLLPKTPPDLKKELETATTQQSVYQLMKEARQCLENGREQDAITRITRIQGMLTPDSPLQQALTDLTLQATGLFTGKGLEESRKRKEAGQWDEAIDALRKTETQLTSYKALDTERADLLALECVDIASSSAKKLHFISAIKASYTGWSISPTNIKARISCIIIVVCVLTALLLSFIALVLAYSYISNILHKDRFDKRLESLREDQKSRRASSSRKRAPREGK